MRTVVKACALQPNATEITVGDGVEKLDELINGENGDSFFQKTFITEGMRELLSKGIARLAGKSNSCIFHHNRFLCSFMQRKVTVAKYDNKKNATRSPV